MYESTKLAKRDNVPQALIVGALCSLENLELCRILAGYIKPMDVDQKSVYPWPLRALAPEGMQNKSELTYMVACKTW